MTARSDTERFVEELQTFSNRRLNFPENLTQILDLTRVQNMGDLLQDMIFHAKFAVKTKDVMARIGRDGEGYEKLSSEFQNSIEKTSALLKTIVKESPEDIKQYFVKNFFDLDQESFAKFMKLLEDLSWVKNWEVDGRALPAAKESENRSDRIQVEEDSGRQKASPTMENVGRIRNGAVLGIILMILSFFADPPVTFLGWGLAVVVMLLLVSIALMSRALVKKSNQLT